MAGWARTPRSLVGRFALAAAVVFVAVGIATHVLLGRIVTQQYRDFADFHAEFVVGTVIEDHLRVEDVQEPVRGERYDELADLAHEFVLLEDVFRVKIWRPDGTIVFSDEPRLVGERFEGERFEIRKVIADGRHSEVTDLTGDEHTYEHDLVDRAVQTYVPIEVGGFPAVAEIYQDFAPTAAATADFTHVLDGVLAIGLIVLYVLLLPVARRAGRKLGDQADELASQRDELERLLSQEKETVYRLEELGDMKDTFLTAVSHELRTPLTVLKAGAQTLDRRRDDLDPAMRTQLVERIAENAQRLDELLSSLLDLDRLTRGVVEPDRRPTNLRALVHRVLEEVSPRRPVVAEVPDVEVRVDPAQVERIVENLIVNAMRHTPPRGAVEVHADVHDDHVLLRVDDEGPGVPDDIKRSIFDPFHQGPSLHPESPGTGVGLSLVERFAQLHGGRAWVQDRPGGGASFRVRLPYAPLRGVAPVAEPVAHL